MQAMLRGECFPRTFPFSACFFPLSPAKTGYFREKNLAR
ncbi:hypothetical protein yinte0001_14760 [Yersinia intermedia ATCC 29909]|jgi:hypothetical protein|nr:hypothetical protein yinte0001_14760 [Yersinia intermedia ATCC 29909]